jgi:rRNA maturation endonuclease Nob1
LSEEPRPKVPVDKSVRVLLLDTSAFIMGYETTDVEAEHYTVPLVQEELREGDLAELRFDSAVRRGRLKVVTPNPENLSEVRAVILEMGEAGVLSATDEPVIVSDDYSVQNVADRLGLGFRSLATPGIKRRFEWVIYCPGCHKIFSAPQPGKVCPMCGTELRRRPGRKRLIS